MFDSEGCVDCLKYSNACPGSIVLPFSPRPLCPSANVRRQHTRDFIAKKSNTGKTRSRSLRGRTFVDSLKVVGKKIGSEFDESPRQTCCEQLVAFDDESTVLPYNDHYDSAAEFHDSPSVDVTTLTTHAGTGRHCDCHDSCSCEHDTSVSDKRLSVNYCQSTLCQCQQCPTCQKQAPFLDELEKINECSEFAGAEIKIKNLPETYHNARIDQNHTLKLLRKFDTIRQRACAAREACLVRFEMRQKQRLHLLDLTDSEYQQKDAGQEVFNDKLPRLEDDSTATAARKWYDIADGGRTGDVKLRDVIDLCGPVRPDYLVTTCPLLLDNDSTSVEPTDSTISRLMSQFERIRLHAVNARLENQKRFENKRKQRKYKI